MGRQYLGQFRCEDPATGMRACPTGKTASLPTMNDLKNRLQGPKDGRSRMLIHSDSTLCSGPTPLRTRCDPAAVDSGERAPSVERTDGHSASEVSRPRQGLRTDRELPQSAPVRTADARGVVPVAEPTEPAAELYLADLRAAVAPFPGRDAKADGTDGRVGA
jgi:hypothetical protein